MIVKMHAGVIVGDYIRGHGYRMENSPGLAFVWRKVIEVRGDTLVTEDRRGYRREFSHRQGRKWKVWTPGDPREDGDNL